jgi:hypothetical protein
MGAALCFVMGCGADPLPDQHPPDLDALVAAYDRPDGVLDQSVLVSSVLFYFQHRAFIEDLELDRSLIESVREAFGVDYAIRSTEIGTRQDELSALADGYAVIRRICSGWEDPKPDAKTHGWIELRGTFDASGPDPVLWGHAQGCRYLVADRRILLDGGPRGIRLHIGEGLSFDEVGEKPVLLDIDLTVHMDDDVHGVRVDFRVTGTSLVEVRVPRSAIPAAGGDIVLGYSGGQLIQVRARNGRFACDPAEMRCVGEDGSVYGF